MEIAVARELGRLADELRARLEGGADRVAVEVAGRSVALPSEVCELLADLFDDLSEGRQVTVAPADLLVGTERAAEILGVSRVWMVELLERGRLPMVRIGTHRRVRLGDLLAFRRADDRRRREQADWTFLEDKLP